MPSETPESPAPRRAVESPSVMPPWWSFLLMLFFVVAAVLGIVMLVLALGVRSAPLSTPRLEVLTADPALLAQSITPQPQAGGESGVRILSVPTVAFVMDGPMLEPNYSPTPISIVIGRTVIVVDVGDQQLNVRDNPGVLGTNIVFRAPESTAFIVVDGPLQGDGLTWWKIQDPNRAGREGWAASNYLQPVPSEPTP